MSKTKRYTLLGLSALALVIIWLVQQSSLESSLVVDEVPALPVSDLTSVNSEANSSLVESNTPSVQFDIKQVEETAEKTVQNATAAEAQELIAAIERDMELTLPSEGDMLYMSPENETVQALNPQFPAIEPEDTNLTLGQEADDNQKLGVPFEDEPEID